MVTAIVNHEVKNYADWRKVFDADAPKRSAAGFNTHGVYQAIENPNKITIIGEAPSVEAIKRFFEKPELKAAMEEGGVISEPEVKLLSKT